MEKLTTGIPINVSEKALYEIQQIIKDKNIPEEYALRIGMKGGGCGATFLIGFDQQGEHDEVYEINDISILVDKRHLMYLIGTTVDFEEQREEQGFVFHRNENK